MIQLQHRPNDFGSPEPVVGYSGGCCCCCCLHWIGAVAGGGGGILLATTWRRTRRPLYPGTWRYLWTGFLFGALLTVGIILLAVAVEDETVLVAVIFVPSVVFVLPGAGMMLMGAWHAHKKGPPTEEDGAYCLKCRYDVRGLPQSSRCPECGTAIDWSRIKKGREYGLGLAWRITWMSVLFSSLISGAGYLIMLPML